MKRDQDAFNFRASAKIPAHQQNAYQQGRAGTHPSQQTTVQAGLKVQRTRGPQL